METDHTGHRPGEPVSAQTRLPRPEDRTMARTPGSSRTKETRFSGNRADDDRAPAAGHPAPPPPRPAAAGGPAPARADEAQAGAPAPDDDVVSGTRADFAPTGAGPQTTFLATLKRTAKEFSEDNLTDWAAALTYYGVQALFPALLAVLSII